MNILKKVIISIISIIFVQTNFAADLLQVNGNMNNNQSKIMKFQNDTAIRIQECLQGKETQASRKNVLFYKHGKKTFDLNNCKFLGDCSWWATTVLENTFPKLYEKMKPLSEEGKPILRAYVWFHIFNNLLELHGRKKINDVNKWVLSTTPEQMKKYLIKNNVKGKEFDSKIKSYTQRYNYFKKTKSNTWKNNLKKINKDWNIIKNVKNFQAGDFAVIYYKWNKNKMKRGKSESTGHSVQITQNSKLVKTKSMNPANQLYKTYKIQIMDSSTSSRKINEKIRRRADSGIGIRTIFIRVNKATNNYAGWKSKWDDSEKKLNSFNWYTKGWKDSKGKIIAGRISPAYVE